MSPKDDNLYDALEKIFHEPNRLAIMSAVCASHEGMTFNELKETCNLTDGNLNRHLKVLEEAGVVLIEKAFVDNKPRTTIGISATGLDRFTEYLSALNEVLRKARTAIPAEQRRRVTPFAVPQHSKA
ncbi:MAG: transcriptional regulator [Verrucomicrobia bacterium]|nr:transcriptional regulator [Verrucomicrobiota bacterium]